MSPALATSPEFTFDEESHTYRLGNQILPSITQILDELGYIDKTGYREEHRYRGSYVHWCIRLINEGRLDRNEIDPNFVGYVDACFLAMADLKIEPTIFEKPMYHPTLLFAGTPDMITDDAVWEVKTGEIKPWVKLQTIGQELLVRAGEARPKRRKRFGLRLNSDGTYEKPIEFRDAIQDEAVFKLNVAAVRNKPLYGAPMLRGLKHE